MARSKVQREPVHDNGRARVQSPFRVRVSNRFIISSLLACILVAFAVGRTARVLLIIRPQKEFLKQQVLLNDAAGKNNDQGRMRLPNPVLKGKQVPRSSYTSKNFDTARSASINSRWVVTEEGKEQCVDLPGSECAAPDATAVIDIAEIDDEPHFPEGQHLLIDIENVDSAFLNSEERLANAMLGLVNQCGLTLLSYHCHGLAPEGVSCAGVLLESHVSFHTWPSRGVITLDLFTCGPNSLLPIVPLAEELFAVPSAARVGDEKIQQPQPQMVWAHKYRGFSDKDAEDDSAEITDFFHFPIGIMTDYKQEIVTAETDFQRVDIYDVLRPHFQTLEAFKKSLSNDGSYEAQHPELFEPDRIVFLDGVLQSRRSGDAPYHEALVHPALFAHKNPKRVAIIGGGEGATLREVLKHKTVEKVIMIEIDEKMVNLSREYLPFWSDCSMLKRSPQSCFEDPRVEVYYEDAFKWFIDRYMGDMAGTTEPFDVIIMDALDPQVQKDFVDALYDGGPFLQSLPTAVAPHGVFVAQVGQAPNINDGSEEFSMSKNRVNFIRSLVDLGFESIRDYKEAHGGFEYPWQFIVAFKSFDSRADWFVEPALVDLKIRKRLIPTVDGGSPLQYFDGSTMISYLYPSRASETVFCHRISDSVVCKAGHGFDPERNNLPLSTLEVKESSLGEYAGKGVFAKETIPHLSYVGLEKLIHILYMNPTSYAIFMEMAKHSAYEKLAAESIRSFVHGYGHSFSHHGRIDVYADPTFQCFINHGCNGSNNVGHDLQITEATADPGNFPEELLWLYSGKENVYNPAAERQPHSYSSAVPRRDIEKGEELFDNYLGMTGRAGLGWKEDVLRLKGQCQG